MITKENAVNLVKEFETAKKEIEINEIKKLVENAISPKIEKRAREGFRTLTTCIPMGINVELVDNILRKNGFNINCTVDPRTITITW